MVVVVVVAGEAPAAAGKGEVAAPAVDNLGWLLKKYNFCHDEHCYPIREVAT